MSPAVEAGPPDNREAVLTAIGRAATPQVAAVADGPSLGRLTQLAMNIRPGSALVISAPEIVRIVRTMRPTVLGIPGMLAETAALPEIELLIVDAKALGYGPWLGADDHLSRHLAEEIFEAGRLLRARGDQAWFIPNGVLAGTMTDRLLSTFTAHLGEVPDEDLEEGATQSQLWTQLVSSASNGRVLPLNNGSGQ